MIIIVCDFHTLSANCHAGSHHRRDHRASVGTRDGRSEEILCLASGPGPCGRRSDDPRTVVRESTGSSLRPLTRLGEKDAAFQWLEKAFQQRDTFRPDFKVHPMFASLRSDLLACCVVRHARGSNPRPHR
jgi:hypothetical protein